MIGYALFLVGGRQHFGVALVDSVVLLSRLFPLVILVLPESEDVLVQTLLARSRRGLQVFDNHRLLRVVLIRAYPVLDLGHLLFFRSLYVRLCPGQLLTLHEGAQHRPTLFLEDEVHLVQRIGLGAQVFIRHIAT